jgi:hypothetical protein
MPVFFFIRIFIGAAGAAGDGGELFFVELDAFVFGELEKVMGIFARFDFLDLVRR